jgi:hypothetical protein
MIAGDGERRLLDEVDRAREALDDRLQAGLGARDESSFGDPIDRLGRVRERRTAFQRLEAAGLRRRLCGQLIEPLEEFRLDSGVREHLREIHLRPPSRGVRTANAISRDRDEWRRLGYTVSRT